MQIKRLLYIEDSLEKYMDVSRVLRRLNITDIEWATTAEKAMTLIEKGYKNNSPFDVVLSDMHFDYFGIDDHEAGEKLMKLVHEKGYDIPFVFCSSQNWKIPESMGNVFYNPRRNWEIEMENLFKEINR